MSIELRELKARKAKFGFAGGTFTLRNVVEMGKFIEALRLKFDPELYAEDLSGYNKPEYRVYTDDNTIAEWIRNYKF